MVLLINWFHYFPAYLMLCVSIMWFEYIIFSKELFILCRGGWRGASTESISISVTKIG